MISAKKLRILFFLPLFTLACRVPNSEEIVSSQLDQSIPLLEMQGLQQEEHRSDDSIQYIEADQVLIYDDRNRTESQSVTFLEENRVGEVLSSGNAEQVVVTEKGDLVNLTGNVTLYSGTEKITVSAESLSWDKQKRIITGDGRVLISREDSELRGSRIIINLIDQSVILSGNTGGFIEQDS